MISNNILAAPQVADMNALYIEWSKIYGGSYHSFEMFMTVPSVRRDSFLSRYEPEIRDIGEATTTTY